MTAPVIAAPAPEIVVAEPIVLEIRAGRREELDAKLAAANKRLARAGISDRFSAAYEPFTKTVRKGAIELDDGTLFGGVDVLEDWLRVNLNEFSISTGHYTFVAALVAEEAGYTVHSAPGQSLDGWQRPPVDDIHCDHCNLKRDRKRLYIIRDERDGSLAQIGHSCIELYTGLKIKGLWALEFDQQLRGFDEDDDSYGGGGSRYSAPVNIVLGLAFSFSDEGRSYISVRAAEAGVGEATGGLVRSTIFYPPRQPSSRDPRVQAAWREYMDKVRRGYEFAKDEALISDIIASAETLKAGTDYADNMHVILAGESGYVGQRNVGILASLVAVYAREKELAVKREQEKKAPPASGFLAPVKQRVKDIEIALTTVRQFEGHYGWTTLLIGRTPEQHIVKWFASGRYDYEPGDTIKLAAATVKAHEVYEGTDQTVITRGKFAA